MFVERLIHFGQPSSITLVLTCPYSLPRKCFRSAFIRSCVSAETFSTPSRSPSAFSASRSSCLMFLAYWPGLSSMHNSLACSSFKSSKI